MKKYLKLILKAKIARAQSEYYDQLAAHLKPTPEAVKPTPEAEAVKPTPEAEAVKPTPEAEAVKPTPEVVKPKSTPEAVKPKSTPEAVKPKSTPEAVKPKSTPEAVKPKSTPEAVKPKSTPEAVKPKSTPEAVKPKSTPEAVDLSTLTAEVDIYKKANSAKEALALLEKHDLKLAGTLGRCLSAFDDHQRAIAADVFLQANDPEIKNNLVKEAGDALREAVKTSGDRDGVQALLLEHTGVSAIGMLSKVSQGKIEALLLALVAA